MVTRRAVSWTVAVLALVVAACICLWDWLSDGSSNSATIRNLGLFAIVPVSIWLAIWRNGIARSQAETSRGSLLNERYQKGAEMLAGPTPLERIGGIHALRQIAHESPDAHREQVVKLLAAFVQHPPRDKGHDPDIDPAGNDVEAAVEAIHSCRTPAPGRLIDLDLRGVNLRQIELYGISLEHADLTGAILRGARLADVNLSGAQLAGADLQDAVLGGDELSFPCYLIETNLSGANLAGADLAGNDLRNSDCSKALLAGAFLVDADLRGANLAAADLTGADLAIANLGGADLTDAILANTDLSAARLLGDDSESQDARPARGLRQIQLDAARADNESPPRLDDTVRDAESGLPLIWNRTQS